MSSEQGRPDEEPVPDYLSFWENQDYELNSKPDLEVAGLSEILTGLGIDRWMAEHFRMMREGVRDYETFFDPQVLAEIAHLKNVPDCCRDFPSNYVYVFVDYDSPLYVGESEGGVSRIVQHLEWETGLFYYLRTFNSPSYVNNQVSLYIWPVILGRKEFEEWLIRTLKPRHQDFGKKQKRKH